MNNTSKANQWLRRFELNITSNSRRVYANGRQQVEVTVTLEPGTGHRAEHFPAKSRLPAPGTDR
ncbi:hypothetical protein [Pseudomonas sp. RIT623]|uniref:hypothetical protein n=1 Tax=Pseudomonas sp. RIT623 TaxID=2559075 RepID=UPI0010700268|nr:hypothetical protein [Pseudomonas sp. RIT623]TFF41212.1 hypothetical protein E3U47_11210 [Pseudomonas sp. RIT623]